MPAGGVADHCDSVTIEIDAADRKLREAIDASSGVVHYRRPPSPGLS
jgi:hypothetical protein